MKKRNIFLVITFCVPVFALVGVAYFFKTNTEQKNEKAIQENRNHTQKAENQREQVSGSYEGNNHPATENIAEINSKINNAADNGDIELVEQLVQEGAKVGELFSINVSGLKNLDNFNLSSDQLEDGNIRIIRDFYAYLKSKKFQDAYNLYYNVESINYEMFTSKYKDLDIVISSLKKVENNKYEFNTYEVENYGIYYYEKQKIIAEIKNGKIKFTNPELKIVQEIEKNGNKVTFKKSPAEDILIFKNKTGKEHILAVYFANFEHIKENFSFSETGRYIQYTIVGWEYSDTNIYDTTTNTLNSSFPNPHFIQFSDDERYLVACGNAGISGGGFVTIKDMYKSEVIYSPSCVDSICSYDTTKKVFHIEFDKKIIEFNTLTRQFQEK